jgi:hypothetical protein
LWWKNLNGKGNMGDVSVDGKIILKYNVEIFCVGIVWSDLTQAFVNKMSNIWLPQKPGISSPAE